MSGYEVRLRDLQDVYSAPKNALERVVKPAIDMICWARQTQEDLGIPDVLTAPPAKDWWNTVCAPTAVPGNPAVNTPVNPPPGGQCRTTRYRVDWNLIPRHAGNPPAPIPQGFNAFGPISFAWSPPDTEGDISLQVSGFAQASGNQRVSGTIIIRKRVLSQGLKQDAYTGLRMAPESGGPDNCGNGAPFNYPPVKSPKPPDFPELPEVPGAPAGRGGPVLIPPIIVGPGAIQPTVVVNVGPNTVAIGPNTISIVPTIQIGPGGGTINPAIPGTPTGAPLTYEEARRLLGQLGVFISDKVEEVLAEAEAIRACTCGPSGDVVLLSESSGQSGQLDLPFDRSRFVTFAYDVVPVNAKSQPGGNAPDVLYSGWAWFSTISGFTSERLPLDSMRKIFINDKKWSRFYWTCYTGSRGKASSYGVLTQP